MLRMMSIIEVFKCFFSVYLQVILTSNPKILCPIQTTGGTSRNDCETRRQNYLLGRPMFLMVFGATVLLLTCHGGSHGDTDFAQGFSLLLMVFDSEALSLH